MQKDAEQKGGEKKEMRMETVPAVSIAEKEKEGKRETEGERERKKEKGTIFSS